MTLDRGMDRAAPAGGQHRRHAQRHAPVRTTARQLGSPDRSSPPRTPTGTRRGTVFNLTLDLQPAAVALPRDVARRGRGRRLRARARAAGRAPGHRPQREPLGALEDTLLVDVRELQEVAIDPARQRVRVGAGVKWERVAPQLSEHGLAGLHGSSPDVGIAGYSLGGGMGWLARKHGLQTNSVTAIELVTADGVHAPRRRDARGRPVLGAARRQRQLRRGDGDRVPRSFPSRSSTRARCSSPSSARARSCDAWAELFPGAAGRADGLGVAAAVPGRCRTCRSPSAAARSPSCCGAFLGERGRGPRPAAPACATWARRSTRSRWCRPWSSATWRWTRPTRCPSSAPRRCSTSCRAGVDALVDGRGPGLRLPAGDGAAAAAWAARSRARRPGAGRARPCPARSACSRSACPRTRRRPARCGAYLGAVDRAVEPYRVRRYPNFVEEPADASTFFDARTWARLRAVKARVRPRRPLQGQPLHPGRLGPRGTR